MNVVNMSPGLSSIRFLTGPLAGSTFQISKQVTTIGREPTNDIIISDPSVSRHHARLLNTGGQWSIEKLAPQNIVTVNQRDVQQATISDRDTISLGSGTTFMFLISSPHSPADQRFAAPYPAQPTQAMPSAPLQSVQLPQAQQASIEPVLPELSPSTERASADFYSTVGTANNLDASGIPSLEISSNIHSNKQSFPLTKQVINIGRDPSNDIVINELVVSAFHAQVIHEGNQLVFVQPHPARGKTLNGILYQGRHIRGDESFRKALTRGDILRIGDEHGTLVTLTYNDG